MSYFKYTKEKVFDILYKNEKLLYYWVEYSLYGSEENKEEIEECIKENQNISELLKSQYTKIDNKTIQKKIIEFKKRYDDYISKPGVKEKLNEFDLEIIKEIWEVKLEGEK